MSSRSSSSSYAAAAACHGKDSMFSHVFGWGLRGILSDDLLGDKVSSIPSRFSSVTEYLASFMWPLLEEMRCSIKESIQSIAVDVPYVSLVDVSELSRSVVVDRSRVFKAKIRIADASAAATREEASGISAPLFSSNSLMLLLTQKARGPMQEHLSSSSAACAMAVVTCKYGAVKKGNLPSKLKFAVSAEDAQIVREAGHLQKALYAVNVTNLSTFLRTWKALHTPDAERLPLPNRILNHSLDAAEEQSKLGTHGDSRLNSMLNAYCSSRNLNESQSKTITSSIAALRSGSSADLCIVQGPPGTGKTSTLITLLSVASCAGQKCLVTAQTNVAVAGAAMRFMEMMISSQQQQFGDFLSDRFKRSHGNAQVQPWRSLSPGDVVLLGSKAKLGVEGSILEAIYLDRQDSSRMKTINSALIGWIGACSKLSELLISSTTEWDEEDMGNLVDDVGKGKDRPSPEMVVRMKLRNLVKELTRHGKALAQTLPASDAADVSSTVLTHSRHLLDYVASRDFANLHDFAASVSECEHRSRLLVAISESLACEAASSVTEQSIERNCLKNASVIFSTVSTAGNGRLQRAKPFSCVIVDEAAQLVEADTAILTCTLAIGKAILVGDPQQLPATVISTSARRCSYGRSLMERLMNNGFPCHILDTQYRMHPWISKFPNANFYDSRLVDGENVLSPSYGALESLLYGPYAFIDVEDGEEDVGSGKSKMNTVEATVVLSILENLQKAAVAGRLAGISVGVITPYASQRELLREHVEQRTSWALLNVDVSSVDGFQGQERDVIILSVVRANKAGTIGFVNDRRRLNVAMTRARYCFWIVGHLQTLRKSHDNLWCDVLQDIEARGLFWSSADDPTTLRKQMQLNKQCNGNPAAVASRYNGKWIRKCLLDERLQENEFDVALSFICRRDKERGNSGYHESSDTLPPVDVSDEYLLDCAANYHRKGDSCLSVSTVNALSDVNLKCKFLRYNGYVDELIRVEEMVQNYVGAATLAEQVKGDVLLAAELLEKGNLHAEAIEKLLFWIRADLLWEEGCKGWGEKNASIQQQPPAVERLNKVKALARAAAGRIEPETELELKLMFAAAAQTGGNGQTFEKAVLQAQNQCSFRLKTFALWNALNASKDILQQLHLDSATASGNASAASTIEDKIQLLIQIVKVWKEWRDTIVRCKNSLRSRNEEDDSEAREFCYGYFGVRLRNEEPDTCQVHKENPWWLQNYKKKSLPAVDSRKQIALNEFERLAAAYWGEQLHSYDTIIPSLLRRSLKQQKRSILDTKALNIRERMELLVSLFEIHSLPFPGGDIKAFVGGLCRDIIVLLWPPKDRPIPTSMGQIKKLRKESRVTAILDHVADTLVADGKHKKRSGGGTGSNELVRILPYVSKSWKEKNGNRTKGRLDVTERAEEGKNKAEASKPRKLKNSTSQ